MHNLKKGMAIFLIFIFGFTQISFASESFIWEDTTLEVAGEETSRKFSKFRVRKRYFD